MLRNYQRYERSADAEHVKMYIYAMSPRRLHNFYLDSELSEGLKAVKDRDGISEAVQVRRAIRIWLEQEVVLKKSAKK